MPIGDCGECLKLLQNVTRAARMHMDAIARHENSVQHGADDDEITYLKRASEDRSIERQDAVDRYRTHLRSHQNKTMAAGE